MAVIGRELSAEEEEQYRREELLNELLGETADMTLGSPSTSEVPFINPWERSQGDAELSRLQATDQPGTRTIAVTDPTTTDSLQYQQELARAQGRSGAGGFVATEVSPTGEVIAPGFDSSYQTQEQLIEQAKLEAAAQRYKGQQMYASLIKNGATPAEAIRLAGADLFANNPTGLVNAVVKSQARPPAIPQQRMVRGQPTRAALAQEDNIKQEIRSLRETLSGGRYGTMAAPKGEDKKQIEDRLKALEAERVRILDRPEFNPNVDQIGYARIRGGMESEPIPRPQIAPAPSTQVVEQEAPKITTKAEFDALPVGAVYITKDGRKARKT